MRGGAGVAAAAAVIALVAGACSGRDPNEVLLNERRFTPETITVERGTTVVFTDRSDEAHTVTAYEDSIPPGARYFASGGIASEEDARAGLAEGLIEPDEMYEVTLDVPGTYRYFCIPHEGEDMTGTIVVEQ